ncbi:MAG: hypothetical protein FWC55_07140 [Firmicutes bacterium]|nr:hypothetical protein [Bacillota bacterium]
MNKEFLKKLKQTDISADAEKTKERLAAVWNACGKEDRRRMAEMIDGAVSTFKTAVSKGRISAKLAIPMAVVGDVDPAYLTAETDAPASCTDAKIDKFLAAHGYGTPEKAEKPPRRGRRKAEAAAETEKPKAKPRRKRKSAAEKAAEVFIAMEEAAADEPDLEEIPVIAWAGDSDEYVSDAAYVDPDISELLVMADEKIAAFDPDKFAALDDLSFSDIEVLIRSLEIRACASDSARTLMRLVRLLLV